jgi:hypothetical protein
MDAGLMGVLGTVLGVLIGGPITYYYAKILVQKTHENALELFHRQEFNKGAAVFTAACVDERFQIRRWSGVFWERFCERREEHEIAFEKAKIIFEPFLAPDEKTRFNVEWDEYKNPSEKNKKIYSPLDPEHQKELENIALRHIEKLLSYAKPISRSTPGFVT